jgi:5'(3')-deoxyribonucleotidase
MSNFARGKKSKAISDRSGLAFPYREMMYEWNGSFVHKSEWEPKHPQLVVRRLVGDLEGLRDARPARVEPKVATMLGFNPFVSSTAGDQNIYINEPDHNLIVGDIVRFRTVSESFTSQAPSTSWLLIAALQTSVGFTVTAVTDANNYKVNPAYDAETFLAANCVPGTTTLYIDMDGVLTSYYQAIATYNNLTTWFAMTSAMQATTIAANAANFFTNLTKLARADSLIAKAIAENGSYTILTTDTGSSSLNTQKTNWINTNYSGALAPTAIIFATNFNKAPYGGANKILVDDTQLYVDQFSGAGGLTYKYWQSPGPMSAGGGLVSSGPVTLTP